jgi:hypothetical protein
MGSLDLWNFYVGALKDRTGRVEGSGVNADTLSFTGRPVAVFRKDDVTVFSCRRQRDKCVTHGFPSNLITTWHFFTL